MTMVTILMINHHQKQQQQQQQRIHSNSFPFKYQSKELNWEKKKNHANVTKKTTAAAVVLPMKRDPAPLPKMIRIIRKTTIEHDITFVEEIGIMHRNRVISIVRRGLIRTVGRGRLVMRILR